MTSASSAVSILRRVRPAPPPLLRAVLVITLASVLQGCGEVRNPTETTLETAEPLHLARGALAKLEDDYRSIADDIFIASDEGDAVAELYKPLDESGNVSQWPFQEVPFAGMHHARALATDAIALAEERGEEAGEEAVALHARVIRGWVRVRLAELWGDQPVDGTPTTREALLRDALADFEAALASPVPDATAVDDVTAAEMRLHARAGVARVQWNLGTPGVDPAALGAAIDAAAQVLAADPDFLYGPVPARNWYTSLGASYRVSPAFQDIPHPFPIPNLDPRGIRVKFIDADELWLIQAEAHLLLGRLAEAKQAVKQTPLLPVNHVRLGREPADAEPLGPAEIDALIDPLDAEGVRVVIEELRRESWFGWGRRNRGPNGPILPVQPPPNA